MDDLFVQEILQDIEKQKIKTKEEVKEEIKLKLYELYKPFLKFESNQDNFGETYEKLQGYQYMEANNLDEGDYIRYLNPKYFYDIKLMKGGFISDINKLKKQIVIVNGNKVIKLAYPKLLIFKKLDDGDIIKQKIIESLV